LANEPQKKANAIIGKQDFAPELDPLLTCVQNIESILSTYYDTSLISLTQNAFSDDEEQLREVIRTLFILSQKMRKASGIKEAKTYLESAITNLYLVLHTFDDQEEREARKRWRTRYEELIDCRNNLQKAVEYLRPMVRVNPKP
jgi:hypothetical protein